MARQILARHYTVVMLLAILAMFVFLGLGTVPVSFPAYVSVGLSHTLTIILSIIGLCPGMLALPGLFNRKRAGRVFSYYAQILHIAGIQIGFHLINVLFGFLFLMLLSQVRDYYH